MKEKTILITGGAGYVGLNVALQMIQNGCSVVIVDNLKNSYAKHVNSLLKKFPLKTKFYKGNVCDYGFMKNIFKSHEIDVVLHLAAYKYIGESFKKPRAYLTNNMKSLKTILKLSEEFNVLRVAFSSSAVVYGNAGKLPVNENTEFSPLSPYAETKCDGEKMLCEWHSKTNIATTIFRFSNPVGANTKHMFGDHSKKGFENLVPYIVKMSVLNQPMVFRGNTHPTADGTAVRDYIHVSDLAEMVAYVLTTSKAGFEVLNVASGKGTSVLQILKETEKLLNKKSNYTFAERNLNEASVSVLDTSKLSKDYSLFAKRELSEIIDSQIKFYQSQIAKK